MKVIDLLNKIAKGEEVPRIIKWRNGIYKYNFRWEDYKKEAGEIYFFQTMLKRNSVMVSILNDEVEIIEEEIIEEEKEIEKEIEKIIISMDDDSMPYVTNNKYQKLSYSEVDLLFASKINELIDLINDMRDKEC